MNTPIMQMPGLPIKNENLEGLQVPSGHSSPVPAVQAAGSDDVLNPPSHETVQTPAAQPQAPIAPVKPIIESFETKIHNRIEIKVPTQGIEVIAARNGFFNQERVSEGKKFFVRNVEELGDWMICTDPDNERKRAEFFKEKKLKAKKK